MLYRHIFNNDIYNKVITENIYVIWFKIMKNNWLLSLNK
jgi:hypothetical protein